MLSNEIPLCSTSCRFFSTLQSKAMSTRPLSRYVCILATIPSRSSISHNFPLQLHYIRPYLLQGPRWLSAFDESRCVNHPLNLSLSKGRRQVFLRAHQQITFLAAVSNRKIPPLSPPFNCQALFGMLDADVECASILLSDKKGDSNHAQDDRRSDTDEVAVPGGCATHIRPARRSAISRNGRPVR